jgi:lactocepin
MKRICFCLVLAIVFSLFCFGVSAKESDFKYELTDGGVEITAYNGDETEVVVPSEIEGQTVVSIGYKAFANENMRKVTLPETVVYVSDSAFLDCIFLEEVVLPSGIDKINFATFKGCTLLRKVMLPQSVVEISAEAFCNCPSLQTVGVIPSGVTTIGENAFFKCISLKSFEVDENNPIYKCVDGVIYTENGAVLALYPPGKNDKTFLIPENVSIIESDAFESSQIKEIVVPATVKEVRDNAFHLSSVKDVTFEGDIILGECAFLECLNLESAVFKKSVEFGANPFDMCDKVTVYAKKGDAILEYAVKNNLYYGYVDGEKITKPFQKLKIDWGAVIFWVVAVIVVLGGFILFRIFGTNRESERLINK